MKRDTLSFNPARFISSHVDNPGWRLLGNLCRVGQAVALLCLALYAARLLARVLVSAVGLF
jgi:hypothetical protein